MEVIHLRKLSSKEVTQLLVFWNRQTLDVSRVLDDNPHVFAIVEHLWYTFMLCKHYTPDVGTQ